MSTAFSPLVAKFQATVDAFAPERTEEYLDTYQLAPEAPAPNGEHDPDAEPETVRPGPAPTVPTTPPPAPSEPEPTQGSGLRAQTQKAQGSGLRALAPDPDPLLPAARSLQPAASGSPPEAGSRKPEAGESASLPYLVGVLYYGGIDREHDRCVKALHGQPQVLDVMELTGCPYIDMGRSLIATRVLDDPSIGGLLFIDHDMVFDPKEALALIEAAQQSSATTGAAYSMRRPGHIIGAVDGSKLAKDRKVVFFEGGEVLPANYLGMGMTAIPRATFVKLVARSQAQHARKLELVEKFRRLWTDGTFDGLHFASGKADLGSIQEHFEELCEHLKEEDLPRMKTGLNDADCVPFFSHLRQRGFYYGEDVSFCVRSHEAGLPVQVDTRRRVYHKGSYCYGLEDVGMEVPYCHRLECLDVAEPKATPALFSPHEEVRRALEASSTSTSAALAPSSIDVLALDPVNQKPRALGSPLQPAP